MLDTIELLLLVSILLQFPLYFVVGLKAVKTITTEAHQFSTLKNHYQAYNSQAVSPYQYVLAPEITFQVGLAACR